MATTIIDVIVISVGIIMLATLFKQYIAVSISLVKVRGEKVVRKIKDSIVGSVIGYMNETEKDEQPPLNLFG